MANESDLWIPEGDWRMYEAYIFGALQRRFPEAWVTPNAHLPGIKSGTQRQIDVLVDVNAGGTSFKIAFDCKCYRRKVNVNDVEKFLGMLDDIRVSKGVLVTTKGYTKTAYERAQREPRDVDLQILPPDRLSAYQYIGDVWLWKGPMLATVRTPIGWVADNQDTHKFGGCQFSMYPLGHTLESAKRKCTFLYGNIVLKSEMEPTMEAIAARHERTIIQKLPNARFQRLPSLFPEPPRTFFRVGHIDKSYGGPEYSLYLDGREGVLLLVLLCREGEDETYVPVLKWIGSGAILLTRKQEQSRTG
ncbi:MAG: restriction endonuclease [Candidatus Acidiferrales bacterium]